MFFSFWIYLILDLLIFIFVKFVLFKDLMNVKNLVWNGFVNFNFLVIVVKVFDL